MEQQAGSSKKIDKTLARMKTINWEKIQINKIRNETEAITAGSAAIKRIIKEYCEQLYTHKFDNLEEMGQFLKIHKLPKHNQEKINLILSF